MFGKGDCQCCSIFLPNCLVAVASLPVSRRYRAFEERASTEGGSQAKVDPDTIYDGFANRCSALEYASSPQRAATELFGTHAWFTGQGVNRNHVGKGRTSSAERWRGLGSRRFVVLGCGPYTPKRRQFLYK